MREKRKKGSVSGKAATAHDEAEAERLVKASLKELGLPPRRTALIGGGIYRDEKALIAWLIRKRTSASNGWVAERLAMGHPTSVSRAAARVRTEAGLARRGRVLEKKVMQQITA